jgi:hypothetical protein
MGYQRWKEGYVDVLLFFIFYKCAYNDDIGFPVLDVTFFLAITKVFLQNIFYETLGELHNTREDKSRHVNASKP